MRPILDPRTRGVTGDQQSPLTTGGAGFTDGTGALPFKTAHIFRAWDLGEALAVVAADLLSHFIPAGYKSGFTELVRALIGLLVTDHSKRLAVLVDGAPIRRLFCVFSAS